MAASVGGRPVPPDPGFHDERHRKRGRFFHDPLGNGSRRVCLFIQGFKQQLVMDLQQQAGGQTRTLLMLQVAASSRA